jgi:hypothetical protein
MVGRYYTADWVLDGTAVQLGGRRQATEVLLDGDWHGRRPNNYAEIIGQALALHEQTGKRVLLATCDLQMIYRAAAASLAAVQVPRTQSGAK